LGVVPVVRVSLVGRAVPRWAAMATGIVVPEAFRALVLGVVVPGSPAALVSWVVAEEALVTFVIVVAR